MKPMVSQKMRYQDFLTFKNLNNSLEKHDELMKEVNKIEEKNYKISCLNEEISTLKSSLNEKSSEIDQLRTDLFENSKRSDISITMASSW